MTFAYAVAIVLLTWPWLRRPSSQVLDHWDPPFHAWKLHFGAAHVLAGHLLPPVDSNLYYPHPGAYYYEALHWPQTLLAAMLEAFGANSVLSYHLTLVAFWALSGALFWALLRAMRTGRTAALAGGLFFTLMPYRISYMVEFNMQLVFGVVLFLLFALRFLQKPRAKYIFCAALAWWLQATSELYQAVFVLAAVPFLCIALVAAHPRLLRDIRRLWVPLVAAGGLCLAFSLAWLGPYLGVLDSGTLSRSAEEMGRHALEPFSYLRHAGWASFLPSANARGDEMCAYPTLAILALAAGLAIRRLWRAIGSPKSEVQSPKSWVRSLSLVLVGAMLGLFGLARAGVAPETMLTMATWCGIAALAMTAVAAGVPMFSSSGTARSTPPGGYAVSPLLEGGKTGRKPPSERGDAPKGQGGVLRAAELPIPPEHRFLSVLGAMAILCLFLSFGPEIADRVAGTSIENPVFRFVLRHVHALEGFRVISRFSVFVELFLCAAAAAGLDGLLRRAGSPMRRAAVAVVVFALFLPECRPAGSRRIRPVRDVSQSPTIQMLDKRAEPYVLALAPMGNRKLDSEHMLTIERNDRLGVYAWGGTYPPYTMAVKDAFGEVALGGDGKNAAELLRQIWPEALVLEDRRPFKGVIPVDYAAGFGVLAETLCDDGDLRLLRLVPDTEPRTEFSRLVRPDMLRANPAARFTLASADGSSADIWLDLNGRPLARWHIAGNAPVPVSVALPAEAFVDRLPNRFRLHAEGDRPFCLLDFALFPGPAKEPTSSSAVDLPWLATTHRLPKTATPFDIVYPHGIRLCGAERIASPDGSLGVRYYLRLPRSVRRLSGLEIRTGIAAPGGGNLFEDRPRLVGKIDQNALATSDTDAIHIVDILFPLPDLCRTGETYEATFTLRAASGRLLSGRDANRRKVRHVRLFPFTAQ